MLEEFQQFYINQLKARLEYYRELGIKGLKVANPNALSEVKADSPQRTAETEPAPQAMIDELYSSKTEETKLVIREGVPSLFASLIPDRDKRETLQDISTDLGDCRRCKLCSTRTNIVFGAGDPKARLVFVGEGPGADEDSAGLPFVGRAGQLLTKIIEAIRLTRDQVYICNVVKCRPPNNRFPEPDEVAACSPFLIRQLEAIRPTVICCLGAAAAQTILQTKMSIGRLRGRFHEYMGAKVMPTFHPSYLLRNPEAKRDVWEDMKKVRALLDQPAPEP
jgi:DNA polymerase